MVISSLTTGRRRRMMRVVGRDEGAGVVVVSSEEVCDASASGAVVDMVLFWSPRILLYFTRELCRVFYD